MKHFLFLGILILVIIGLYCKTCVEHLTDEETIKKQVDDSINENLKKIYKTFIDAQINNKLDKIKGIQGPQGPKGDVGDKATSYQGLYCEGDKNLQPISIYSPKSGLNTSNQTNNIVILKPTDDAKTSDNNNSFFILTNKERWQFTDGNEIKSAYNRKNEQGTITNDYGICYNENEDVYICNKAIDKASGTPSEDKHLTTFKYTNDNEFITTGGNKPINKCLTLTTDFAPKIKPLLEKNKDAGDDRKVEQYLKLEKCNSDKTKNQAQRFFLH